MARARPKPPQTDSREFTIEMTPGTTAWGEGPASLSSAPMPTTAVPPAPMPPPAWNPAVPGAYQTPGTAPANLAPQGYNWNQKMANTLMGGTL